MAPLRRPLEWFLGNNVGAAALSMNWDENFFIELVALPTLDSSPERMSDELAARVDELPDLVENYVLGLDSSPYSRRVVARLPEMVRRLAAYTRHGYDKDAAVLRCYLPAAAGHNLLMGAELALAEGQGRGEPADVARSLKRARRHRSLRGFRRMTSLRFAREELEAALDMLAQDVGVTITIRGRDLQLEGITRNQLFGINMTDRSAEEILVEILRRANPDKLATGPADPRQKLVYVVGPEAIFITTRAAAAERGEKLPAVFQGKIAALPTLPTHYGLVASATSPYRTSHGIIENAAIVRPARRESTSWNPSSSAAKPAKPGSASATSGSSARCSPARSAAAWCRFSRRLAG